MATRYADYFPQFIAARHRGRAARPGAGEVRPGDAGPRAARRERDLQFGYLGPADAVRPLLPARARHADRAAAGLLHARGDGPGAEREGPRGARDRVLRRAVDLRFHELDADAVQLRHAALAAVLLLPDHGGRRPRRHLRGDQGERAARQVRRRPGQRLDPGARARLAHQGHQRQVAGRGAVPEGGQRHRGGGEPGRQAQGRGVLLPRDLAPRHRGIPRAAQEHRRRPAPHARHEHRELDSGPVHEARDGERASGRCSSPSDVPDLHDTFGKAFEEAYLRYEDKAARGELKLLQEDPRGAAVAQDAVDAVRDRASVDHVQGSRATCAARSSTSAWCTAPTCAPRSRSTPRPTRSRCATSARSTWWRT